MPGVYVGKLGFLTCFVADEVDHKDALLAIGIGLEFSMSVFYH